MSDRPDPARRRSLWPLAALVLVLALAALDQTLLSTALPTIARELPGDLPLAWVFSAYLLSATVAITVHGRLADARGVRPVLLGAVLVFLAGSAACAASGSLLQLVLARVLQGAGGGGLMTLGMLAVPEIAPAEERGRWQALLGGTYGLATMLGPLAGGLFVEHLGWRWALLANLPLLLLALAVLGRVLPRRAAAGPLRVDAPGAALLAAALAAALLATQHDRLGLPDGLPAGMLAAMAAALGLALAMHLRRSTAPLVPPALFGRPAYGAAAALSLVGGVALYAAVVFLPGYLQGGLHLRPTTAALHLLPLMGGLTLAGVAGARLLRRGTPARRLGRLACGLVLLGWLLLAGLLRWVPHQPLLLSACLLPLGIGIGLVLPVVTAIARATAPEGQQGIATATTVMLRSLGGALGVSLLAALVQRAGSPAQGLGRAFLAAALVAALGLAASRRLPGARGSPPPIPGGRGGPR